MGLQFFQWNLNHFFGFLHVDAVLSCLDIIGTFELFIDMTVKNREHKADIYISYIQFHTSILKPEILVGCLKGII